MIKCLRPQRQNDRSIKASQFSRPVFGVLSLMVDLSFDQNEFDQSDLRPSSRPLILIGQTIKRNNAGFQSILSFPLVSRLPNFSAASALLSLHLEYSDSGYEVLVPKCLVNWCEISNLHKLNLEFQKYYKADRDTILRSERAATDSY